MHSRQPRANASAARMRCVQPQPPPASLCPPPVAWSASGVARQLLKAARAKEPRQQQSVRVAPRWLGVRSRSCMSPPAIQRRQPSVRCRLARCWRRSLPPRAAPRRYRRGRRAPPPRPPRVPAAAAADAAASAAPASICHRYACFRQPARQPRHTQASCCCILNARPPRAMTCTVTLLD